MKTHLNLLITTLIMALLGSGCNEGWELDYGDPEAQFLQEDLAKKGKAFVGKKITVKGTVEKVDVSDPESAWVHMSGGTKCNLGEFKAMAEQYKAGEVVFIDGILKRCDANDTLLEPAIGRDPTAPFTPIE